MTSATRGSDAVVVTGIGATTPVGPQVLQTVTSIRAGIARMTEHEAFEPPVQDTARHFPEPLVACSVAGLPRDLTLIQRLLAMATPALAWALHDAAGTDRAKLGRVHLAVFGGDAPATRTGTILAETVAHRLAHRTDGLQFLRSRYSDAGAAGFLRGLGDAAEDLVSGTCDTVVVGAVDSLLAPETLAALAADSRLKTAENPVGLVPAEAASFAVLELASRARARGAVPYARLGTVSSRVEPEADDQHARSGAALAACLDDVIAALAADGAAPAAIYCNLNGEPRGAEEWGSATQRLRAARRSVPDRLVHPADCMGDAGSAMGAVLACLAAHSQRHDKTAWAPAILWCGTGSGSRAAASLRPV